MRAARFTRSLSLLTILALLLHSCDPHPPPPSFGHRLGRYGAGFDSGRAPPPHRGGSSSGRPRRFLGALRARGVGGATGEAEAAAAAAAAKAAAAAAAAAAAEAEAEAETEAEAGNLTMRRMTRESASSKVRARGSVRKRRTITYRCQRRQIKDTRSHSMARCSGLRIGQCLRSKVVNITTSYAYIIKIMMGQTSPSPSADGRRRRSAAAQRGQ